MPGRSPALPTPRAPTLPNLPCASSRAASCSLRRALPSLDRSACPRPATVSANARASRASAVRQCSFPSTRSRAARASLRRPAHGPSRPVVRAARRAGPAPLATWPRSSPPLRPSSSSARSATATASSSLPARRNSSTCRASRSRSAHWFCSAALVVAVVVVMPPELGRPRSGCPPAASGRVPEGLPTANEGSSRASISPPRRATAIEPPRRVPPPVDSPARDRTDPPRGRPGGAGKVRRQTGPGPGPWTWQQLSTPSTGGTLITSQDNRYHAGIPSPTIP